LGGAELFFAKFQRADLTEAYLGDTQAEGADFRQAIFSGTQQIPGVSSLGNSAQFPGRIDGG
jgi:uncharacterized protein YjbI with pentapeptide repeats